MLVLFPQLSYSVSWANKSITTNRKPASCRSDQSLALLQFKSSFHLDRHSNLRSWKANTDCCTSWDGVACDNLGYVIELDVSESGLVGNIDSNNSLFNLCHLQKVDLSMNDFNFSSIPAAGFARFNRSLTHLYLSDSRFSGEVPSEMFNLPKLKVLHLYDNSGLTGSLPEFPQESALQQLLLLNTNFSGRVPHSIGNLKQLTDFEVSNCGFFGPLPYSFGNLRRLAFLYLSSNSFHGEVPSSFSNLSHLTTLDLSDNLLRGRIPSFISKLLSLEELDLSSNGFHGVVDPRMFASLKNLSRISLSSNTMLSIDTSDVAVAIPSLRSFNFSYCNLSEFPRFLRYQPMDSLELDLSNNQLRGEIPGWLWNKVTRYLDLSYNSLDGFEDPFSYNFSSSLYGLDLSSNNFAGSLPTFTKGLERISLSKNKFAGEIPLTICNTSWNYIDLSHNQMSGEIPPCLFNRTMVKATETSLIDLSKNKLQGKIPDSFDIDCSLEGINLNGNQLEGQLPRSLANCRNSSVLDLGNNQINDTFPFWLEHLERLQVLMLQSNRFHGPISHHHRRGSSSFKSLHIVDLSANSFTGHLPLEYFPSSYLKGHGENDDHQTSQSTAPGVYYTFLMVPNKGQALEYVDVQIPRLNAIDLSSNLFDGEIPTTLGDFRLLAVLNLSRNNLVGKIPSSLVKLTQLQSLDLSNNDLVGEIPQELTGLTFLSVFNVARNHLIGMIPSGGQFFSFPSSSFEGNSRLCGLQLQIDCNPKKSGNAIPPSHEKQSDGTNFDWIFVVAGCASGLIVGVVIEHFLLWRNRYYLEKVMNTVRFFQRKRPLRVRSLRRRS